MCVGFGLIALSLRNPYAPLSPAYDWIADFLPLLCMAARVGGWAVVCLGAIPLITTRRPLRVLMLALCGVLPGGVIGVVVRDTLFPFDPTLSGYARAEARGNDPIFWIGMAIGSCVVLAVIAFWKDPRQGIKDPSDRMM